MPSNIGGTAAVPFAFSNFTSTPIFNQCALILPATGFFNFNFAMSIPLHLTKLDGQTVTPTVGVVSSGPIIDVASNTASGGASITYGVNQLPKISLEGWIDSPMTAAHIPSLVFQGYNFSYIDIIAMYYSGQVSVSGPGVYWQRVDPVLFRDPYGRCYPNPRILTLSASRIEAVPGRHNFQMSLLVGTSS